jgi:O-antigen/teichoic acid export membrane protein
MTRAHVMRQWLGKGVWAIVDQGLFALSNFLVNVLLARWLFQQEYGAFALAYAIFLLLATAHTSLLTDPALVFGAGKYRQHVNAYLRTLLFAHWAFSAVASAVLLLVALVVIWVGERQVAIALLALAGASPFILLQFLFRRVCYIRPDPRLAASGGALYMVLVLGGAVALYRWQWLSSLSALALMGCGSLAAATWIIRGLALSAEAVGREFSGDVLAAHWRYGRWAVGSGVLTALPATVCYLVLPLRAGLESSAALRALMNLIMPAALSYTVLGGLLIPVLVRVRDTPAFARHVRVCLTVFVATAVLYWVALGALHHEVVGWLYGGKYLADASRLWIIGAIPIALAVLAVLTCALQASERPDHLFRASLYAILFTFTIGVWLIGRWGLTGAAAALGSSYVVQVVVMLRSVSSIAGKSVFPWSALVVKLRTVPRVFFVFI